MRDFRVTSGGNGYQAFASVFLAALLTLGLLFLMSFSHGLHDGPKKDLTVRTVTVAPPPPPPREQPQVLQQTPTIQLPNLKVSSATSPVVLKTPPLDLNLQLELPTESSLKIFNFQTDLSEVIGESLAMVFKFGDLDEPPRPIEYGLRFTFPKELLRRGIKKGLVTIAIEIKTNGKANVIAIESATHPQLIPIAKRLVSKATFAPLKVEGQTVTARGSWPVHIQAPR